MRSAIVDGRLEAIAGAPAATLTGVGSTTCNPPNALSARTIYVVWDITGTGDSYGGPVVAGDSVATNGSLRMQTSSPGALTLSARFDTLGGSSNTSAYIGNGRTAGRHVSMIQVNDGLTTGRIRHDKQSGNVALTPGAGIPGGVFVTQSSPGNLAAVFAAQYFAEHDARTQALIMNWLARRFSLSLSL